MVVVMLVAVSCDKSVQPAIPSIGKEYFPLRVGYFQTFDVNEIRYQLRIPETFIYELKTQVVDSFPSEGGYTYVILRSKRNTANETWEYVDTWSARVNNREVVVNEENISFLKIKLPVSVGVTWNGNLYNDDEVQEYLLSDTHIPFAAGGQNFSDCIVVTQADSNDFIVFLDERQEIYAKSIGLVYKESTQFKFCTSTAEGCLGQQIIEDGVVYKQTITSYGVE